MLQSYRPEEQTPNIVFIGVPNIKSLEKALKKLKDNQIPHFCWPSKDMIFSEEEAEYGQGLTAISTIPIDSISKQVLGNYRLWNYSLGTPQGVCRVNPDEGASLGEQHVL